MSAGGGPGGHDITCQQAVGLVTEYLEGTLVHDDRARFEAHLAECPHCTEHVRQIQVTVAVAGRVREEDLGSVAREDLMDLYRRWRDDDRA
jgi:anti-sigma factor RsiW